MPSPENEEVATNEIQITEPPTNTSAMPITTANIQKKTGKVDLLKIKEVGMIKAQDC